MALAEFPFPSVSSTNPIPLYYERLPEEFRTHIHVYDDNGADYGLQTGGTGLTVFIIRYDGLTLTEAALLDNWAATTFYDPENGSAYGFNFRHHIAGTAWTSTAGTLYANCHIGPGGYKTSHTQAQIQAREFIIWKRP